jgi:hypothetical protein
LFAVKRDARGSARRASLPQMSSWTSAHAQGYFSATFLMLVAFDGFTLSPARNRKTPEGLHLESDAQICFAVSARWSGAVRMRVAAEGPAAQIRLS